jgi:hypothetical protein
MIKSPTKKVHSRVYDFLKESDLIESEIESVNVIIANDLSDDMQDRIGIMGAIIYSDIKFGPGSRA